MEPRGPSSFNPVILRENISLLSLFPGAPSGPKQNDLEQFKRNSNDLDRHRLTIEQERDLADNLAFLAATTDDPLKVTAVAIEESSSDSDITIRLAVNSGKIDKVQIGFENIFRLLKETSLNGGTSETILDP